MAADKVRALRCADSARYGLMTTGWPSGDHAVCHPVVMTSARGDASIYEPAPPVTYVAPIQPTRITSAITITMTQPRLSFTRTSYQLCMQQALPLPLIDAR